jgi:hypothetical protein
VQHLIKQINMKNIHLIPTSQPSRLYKTGNFLLLDSKAMPNNTLETMNQHIYITSDLEVKEGDLKVGEYYLYFNKIRQFKEIDNLNRAWKDYKKIILTTDQDLIANGVQSIDDEFLEWFVNNPNCEWVEVIYDKDAFPYGVETAKGYGWYKLPIPQEEPKIDSIFNEANVRFSETLDKLSDNSLKQETTFEEDEIIDISDHDGIGNAVDNLNNEPPQETLEEAAKKQWGNIHRAGVLGFIEGGNWQAERMYSEEDMRTAISIAYSKGLAKPNSGRLSDIPNVQNDILQQFKKK